MSEDVRLSVGKSVERLRKEAGLTQAKLAERMGVDRAYVSGLEAGQRNPTVVTLWHVAQALGVRLGPIFSKKPVQRPVVARTSSQQGLRKR